MAAKKITFRMSQSGHCPRALSAEKLNMPVEPAPVWLAMAAEEGNWHEERIINQLRESGYVVNNQQLEITKEYDTFILTGHIDGLIHNSFSTRLLEIKSMSQFEFDRWMRDDFSAFPQYHSQLACYLIALELKEAVYIVKNRNNGYVDKREFSIDGMPDLYSEILSQLKEISRYVNIGELVPIEPDFDTFECKRCQYKSLCVKSKEDMQIQDEKALQEAVDNWREGNKLVTQGEKLIDQAKATFNEQIVASKINRFRFDDLAIKKTDIKAQLIPSYTKKAYSYLKINDLRKGE